MKKIKIIIFILFPLLVGSLIGITTTNGYQDLVMPAFAPPAIVFPIVWSILYILMGISSYIIYNSKDIDKNSALTIYFFQLILNFIWTPIFFGLKQYFLGTILILLILILVIFMIYKFYKINKLSAYLQIPYLLWLVFAFILSINISILN